VRSSHAFYRLMMMMMMMMTINTTSSSSSPDAQATGRMPVIRHVSSLAAYFYITITVLADFQDVTLPFYVEGLLLQQTSSKSCNHGIGSWNFWYKRNGCLSFQILYSHVMKRQQCVEQCLTDNCRRTTGCGSNLDSCIATSCYRNASSFCTSNTRDWFNDPCSTTT